MIVSTCTPFGLVIQETQRRRAHSTRALQRLSSCIETVMAENEEIVSEKTNMIIVIFKTNMHIRLLRKKQREELPTISLLFYKRPA